MEHNALWLAQQPAQVRDQFYRSLTARQAEALRYHWPFWARPDQIAPPAFGRGHDLAGEWWTFWLILAGRGWGKTRTGAEWTIERVNHLPRVNLIAATADDARDIMVEGESGILSITSNRTRPKYLKNDRKLIWPTGATSLIFTADEPDRLRGKQHYALWADELAAWRYAEAWDQAMLGLRLGPRPQACITTTPRPTDIIKALLTDPYTVTTRGTTYDNRANLAAAFYRSVIKKYEGTRLGRQELLAEILDDNPDALWQRSLLDKLRVRKAPEFKKVLVAVDPQSGTDGAETGIIVVALGKDDHGYVIDDGSLRGSPNEWGTAAVLAHDKFGANYIVAEENQGGRMVEHVIKTVEQGVKYKGVHAAVGKRTRAEPVAALYEQGRVHHLGTFAKLEDQMCQWTPGEDSPDRMDALVWGLTELMIGPQPSRKGVGF